MQVSAPGVMQRTSDPVPVILIGGFLGAVKTCVLIRPLSENHGLRVAVLVNDFGAVNIDAELIVGVEGETVSLKNACICCCSRDDLVKACIDHVSGKKTPDLVVIETSGVSNHIQVANSLFVREPRPHLKLDCMVGVVDAEQLPHPDGDALVLARTQILTADSIALNKVDRVGDYQRTVAKALVREFAPGARILETSHGRIPLKSVLGFRGDSSTANVIGDSGVSHNEALSPHAFSTVHWSSEQRLSLPALRSALQGMTETVYRAKGILCLEELPGRKTVLQLAG